MSELPDVEVHCRFLSARVVSTRLERLRIRNPFVLRSVPPTIEAVVGREVRSVERLGKRIVLGLAEELFVVIHLMIADRLHWYPSAVTIQTKRWLAAFDFTAGCLLLTEAGSTKQASIHVVRAARSSDRTTVAASRYSPPTGRRAQRRWRARTIRSSGRLPTHVCSRASATRTPTRSCTRRGCRRCG